jgi:hypothetical protein
MPAVSRRRRTRILLTLFVLLAPVVPGLAAQRTAVERPAEAQPSQSVILNQDADARETREKLEEILRRLPPAVGRVLRLDPSLLGNESYLSTYPNLAAFTKQHPELKSAPSYFFEHFGSNEYWVPQDTPAVRVWRDLFQAMAIGTVFVTVTMVLVWIVRTLLEYRRWHRTSKLHTEVNNKLLDRFTSNEDLLAYIQTPAGRKFIESAPLSLDSPSRPVGAPFARILWSVQIGVVLAAGALGLLYVSDRMTFAEVGQPLFVIGVLALTLGTGFIVSAAASYMISRRLGLLEVPAAPKAETEIMSGRS